MSEKIDLSEAEKIEIRNTWKVIDPHMAILGSQVFIWIFRNNPDLKDLFPFRETPIDELEKHPVFRNHAYRLA